MLRHGGGKRGVMVVVVGGKGEGRRERRVDTASRKLKRLNWSRGARLWWLFFDARRFVTEEKRGLMIDGRLGMKLKKLCVEAKNSEGREGVRPGSSRLVVFTPHPFPLSENLHRRATSDTLNLSLVMGCQLEYVGGKALAKKGTG